jgi:hypothetical protein
MCGVQICGMMNIEGACGELWSRVLSDDIVCTANHSELWSEYDVHVTVHHDKFV